MYFCGIISKDETSGAYFIDHGLTTHSLAMAVAHGLYIGIRGPEDVEIIDEIVDVITDGYEPEKALGGLLKHLLDTKRISDMECKLVANVLQERGLLDEATAVLAEHHDIVITKTVVED